MEPHSDPFLEELLPADLKFSLEIFELLKGKQLSAARWDSERKELVLRFHDQTTLFIDGIKDPMNISITGGSWE